MKNLLKSVLALTTTALVFSACSEMNSPSSVEADRYEQRAALYKQGFERLETQKQAIKAAMQARISQRTVRLAKANADVQGGKITVPDDYATIQAAVDAAGPDTKIKVKSGVYTEVVEVVDKDELEITAEGAVTVDGGFSLVFSRDIVIENFQIIVGQDLFDDDPHPTGIFALECERIEIRDNSVSNMGVGVFFLATLEGLIKGNICNDNLVTGFYLNNSRDVDVQENEAGGNDVGILVVSSENCEIAENVVNENINETSLFDIYRAGIFLVGAANNVFEDNTCNDNGAGILVLYSDNNTIGSDNVANNNDEYGIVLDPDGASSSNNTIKKNEAMCNGIADIVNLGSGTGNEMKKNETGCL